MKKIIIFTLVLFIFSCGKGSDITKQQSAKTNISNDPYTIAMQHAVAFESSGFTSEKDYSEALSGLEDVVSKDKANADAWFNIGRILFYKKEMSKAKDALNKAITQRGNFVEAYSLLTKIYVFEGNLNGAISIAEQASEVVTDNNVLMNNLAILYIKSDNRDAAKKIVEKIIKKNTKFAPAYVTLGNIYYLNGKYEMARFIYLKAVDEEDESGEVYTNLGIIAEKLDDSTSAHGLLKKAIEKSTLNPYVHNNMGEYYLSAGDYESALKEFNEALRVNPRMVEALVNSAIAYTHVKLFNEAEENYKKALVNDPSFPETYFNYGVFLSDHREQNEEALSLFNKFILLKGKEISDKHRVYRYIEQVNQKNKEKGASKGAEQ